MGQWSDSVGLCCETETPSRLTRLDYSSQQWSILYTLRNFLEAGTCFLVSVSCSGYIEVVIHACCFVEKTCPLLTVLWYVSHFLCVYCVQFDVQSDFA